MPPRYTTPWVPEVPKTGDPRQKDNPIVFGADANPPPMKFDAQGNALPQPDFDQTQPGGGETGAASAGNLLAGIKGAGDWFAGHQPQWDQKTNTQGYWEGVAGQFTSAPFATNNAQNAYSQYMQAMPEISPDANMGAFYDNARTRQAQDMNTQLGARGAFNSSAALDKLAQGQATINATQAKDEAQYGLDRASTMGDLWSKGGEMAGSADLSSREGIKTTASWLDTMGGLASKADEAELGKLTGGQKAAEGSDSARIDALTASATALLGAQGARDSRIQNAFNNISGFGKELGRQAADFYMSLLSGDQEAMDAVLSGDVARVSEIMNVSEAQAKRVIGDAGDIVKAIISF